MERLEEYSSSNIEQDTSGNTSFFDSKTITILVLLFIIYLSYLGINIIPSLANSIQTVIFTIYDLSMKLLGDTSYSTGKILNQTADIVSDTTKGGIDVAEGAVQDIGNLLISANSKEHKNKTHTNIPDHDVPENPIQKPISSSKYNWCLVGEYQNRRGCVPVTESDKCLSNQIFPTQKMCLNPNLSAY